MVRSVFIRQGQKQIVLKIIIVRQKDRLTLFTVHENNFALRHWHCADVKKKLAHNNDKTDMFHFLPLQSESWFETMVWHFWRVHNE